MTIVLASVLVLPATALGQATGTPTAVPAATLSVTPKADKDGLITVNGTGFMPNTPVNVAFNGDGMGTPPAGADGSFNFSFKVPNVAAGDYGITAKGENNRAASTTFTVVQGPATLTFSASAPPGSKITATASNFSPGEGVTISLNGVVLGSPIADTTGMATVEYTLPDTMQPGTFGATATGDTSHHEANAQFVVTASTATPVPTAVPAVAPTATPVPVAPPATQPVPAAPAMAHDERYFSQTQYRIDNDEAWSFFQRNGGVSTFGYPVSRTVTFLGCPVQFFQRQIIQVCPGQGAALMNMLDPEIFPYTRVNGSVFPGPDDSLKANTPPVSDANYSEKISAFVQANVPDMSNGQPVNFFETFNTLGGLNIWGAPISSPQPDPSNPSFIYQRFQRGIMHYIAGTGTESVLLADYLKAILMNQNVPGDLLAQARESKYLGQYCPGNTMWLCRPEALGGTDLTFAFVTG